MSRKRGNESVQRSAPTLVVPLGEAREQIVAQIEKGRQVRARNITNPDQFAEAKADEERWSAYNKTLLLQFFSNDALWKEHDLTYLHAISLSMYGRPPLHEQVGTFFGGLDRRINFLVSVEERLPLMLRRDAPPFVQSELPEGGPPSPIVVHVTDSPQAHVTVHGTDASVSRLELQRDTVFADLRQLVEERIPHAEQPQLLAKIAQLEVAKSTPRFADRYREFMALAADHITVFGTLLAVLAQWLR